MTSSARSGTPPPTDGLIVGELVGPFGVQGEVKLYPLTDFPERLRRYRRLVLALPDGAEEWVDRLTGRTVRGPVVRVVDLLQRYPVACLVRG